MKKIIITFFAIIFATNAFANQLQIINPGSEEGVFRQILTLLGSSFEYEFVQANNPITAHSYFSENDILTIWSSEWPGNSNLPNVEITEQNLIGLISTETLMCSREFTSFKSMIGKDVKIATWGSKPVQRYLEKLGKQYNINFIVVPYEGSGAMVKGFLGLDANTIFTITTREKPILEDTSVNCFAYSQNGDLDFRFVDAIIALTDDQTLIQDLRDNLKIVSKTPEWLEKLKGLTTYIDSNNLEIFNQAVENFSN